VHQVAAAARAAAGEEEEAKEEELPSLDALFVTEPQVSG